MAREVQRVECPACRRMIGTLTRNGVRRIARHAPGKELRTGHDCAGSRVIVDIDWKPTKP